jgi:hypothetical protein
MGTSSETELREWLDRLAIQDLINRYSDAVTRADWQQCEALFAVDAVWETPAGLRFDSAKSFVDFLRPTSSYDVLIQTPHSAVVTLTGVDRASATTTVHELTRGIGLADSKFGQSGAEINLEQYGIYYDDFGRIEGEWKFTHRLFVPVYIGSGRVTGDVFTPRSALLNTD